MQPSLPSVTVGPVAFARTVEAVAAYVRREPGAWAAVSSLVREDPEGAMQSMLALGAVLLDISAEAFEMTPDAMLAKVRRTVDLQRLEDSRRGDSR